DRVDAAEKIAEEACERNPESALLHLLLANVHIRRNDYPALLQDLDAFLTLEPKGLTSEQVRQTREKLQRALANAQRAPLAQAPLCVRTQAELLDPTTPQARVLPGEAPTAALEESSTFSRRGHTAVVPREAQTQRS